MNGERELKKMTKWSMKIAKKHARVMREIAELNAEYDRFFERYNEIVPKLEEAPETIDILDDIRETFELNLTK